jgi:aspartokinase/homoserine dehydrogenase 1
VKGISNLNNMAMFNVSGPGMKGMVGMAPACSPPCPAPDLRVLITQSSSEYSISFCVPQSDCARAKRAMEDEFYLELKEGLLEPLSIMERLAIISVVGDGMRTLRGSRRSSSRWRAPISISWRLPRALPSVLFPWWSAMMMRPPACA